MKGEDSVSKSGLTEIVCILDKSGSMEPLTNDAIGGFNRFLDEQKKLPGEANMTIVLFDTEYSFLEEGRNIQDAQPLTTTTYQPGGGTALLDAVGRTIDQVGARLAKTIEEDRPERVLVCILTDGEENSSREYRKQQIVDKIKTQREQWKWEFIFLGANQDAFAEAAALGINPNQSVNFAATGQGTKRAYASMGTATAHYRATGQTGDWQNQQ